MTTKELEKREATPGQGTNTVAVAITKMKNGEDVDGVQAIVHNRLDQLKAKALVAKRREIGKTMG